MGGVVVPPIIQPKKEPANAGEIPPETLKTRSGGISGERRHYFADNVANTATKQSRCRAGHQIITKRVNLIGQLAADTGASGPRTPFNQPFWEKGRFYPVEPCSRL